MKIYTFSKLFIFIAFSILIFIFADKLVEYLRYFVGGLLITYSIDGLGKLIFEKRKEFYKEPILVYGTIQIILGFIVLFGVENFDDVCIFWGVTSMLREAFEINDILTKKVTGWVAVVSGIESIVTIVFCIILLINPSEHHAKTHVYLLIAELMVTSFPPVLNEIIYRFRKKKK